MKESLKDSLRIVLLLLSFSKVNVSDEHIYITKIEKVSSCPVTEQEHILAAERKNCSTIVSKSSNQHIPHVYHCLPNAWGNESLEMCAPEIEVIGYSCPEYNEGGRRIQPNFNRKCNTSDSQIKCPFKYFSSRSYLYSACVMLSEEATLNVSERDKNSTIADVEPEIAIETNRWLIALPLLSFLVVIIIVVVIKCVWNHCKGNSKQIQNDQSKGTTVPEVELYMLTSEEVHVQDIKE